MYTTVSAALLLLASRAIAQSSSVTSIWAFAIDDQTLVASVVEANPTANVLAIQCPPGTDSNECGFPNAVTITEGPSTLRAVTTLAAEAPDSPSWASATGSVAITLDCTRSVLTEAVCTYVGEEEGVTTTEVVTLGETDFSSMPITITAGLEKLASATGSVGGQTTGAGSSGSVTSGSETATATSGTTRASFEITTGSAATSTQSDAAGKNFGLEVSIAGLAGVLMAAIAL